MKTTIASKIQTLLENYKKAVSAFLSDIGKWEKDSLYSSDHRQDKIREIKNAMLQVDDDFNAQLKTIINDERTAIQKASISKSSDFNQQISNALGFMTLAGDTLTDEQAMELITPFIGDFQTMHHFLTALDSKPGLVKTHKALRQFDFILEAMKHLDENYARFFSAGTYTTNSLGFSVAENALRVDVKEIEGMILKVGVN